MATLYKRKSSLRARQQSKLIEHFVVGSTARATAEVVGVQANTVIRFFMHLRQWIASKVAELPIVRRGRGGRELFRRRSKRKARTRGGGQSGCLRLAGARWEGLHGDRPERQDRNASSHH